MKKPKFRVGQIVVLDVGDSKRPLRIVSRRYFDGQGGTRSNRNADVDVMLARKRVSRTALDAYVQESVDRAVLKESEAASEVAKSFLDGERHHIPDVLRCLDKRVAANRAKVAPELLSAKHRSQET